MKRKKLIYKPKPKEKLETICKNMIMIAEVAQVNVITNFKIIDPVIIEIHPPKNIDPDKKNFYRPRGGEFIAETCHNMLVIAKATGKNITTTFNRRTFATKPSDSVKRLLNRWRKTEIIDD